MSSAQTSDLISDREQQTVALENLRKIDHIIVLMLENRSFDHMLGYLSLEQGRSDVDGLSEQTVNEYNGQIYRPFHLDSTIYQADPPHTQAGTLGQIEHDNGGFVSTFAAIQPDNPGYVMGYYNAADVPVYDHIANHFCILNRWFSATPGLTWPNRLYTTVGHSAGIFTHDGLPVYNLPLFLRQLDQAKVAWKSYSHGISTLRLVDAAYRIGRWENFDLITAFYRDAAAGRLPSVAWIDPNFLPGGTFLRQSTDHPPQDILSGQELVLNIYAALARSPAWDKCLFLITYDEHGGLYDHVPPPEAEDERPAFRRRGVRVPTLVVSPWVGQRSTSNIVFDHTSFLKTLLLRFCQQADGAIPHLSVRVDAANHLGWLLTEPMPRPAPPATDFEMLREQIRKARRDFEPPMDTRPLTELEEQMIAARDYLGEEPGPPDQPPAPGSATPAVTAPTSSQTYTVQPGDTLSGIAARIYGDPYRWPTIYDANRDLIGSNPGLLMPGQILKLP